MSSVTNDDENILLSKAEALLVLVRASDNKCQGGTNLLRVLSNYAAVGADASSRKIKKINTRISRNAEVLSKALDFHGFAQNTINEHPEPLEVVWQWIVENKTSLTSADIVERVNMHPMVIITRDENKQLDASGFRSSGDPIERFTAAGIEVVTRSIEAA